MVWITGGKKDFLKKQAIKEPDNTHHRNLEIIYKLLRKRFGFLNWWPGDSDFEVLVGAILTQQTSWKNVEKAIANLKAADMLNISKISKCEIDYLQQLVHPAGFYRQKASRLKEICSLIIDRYGNLGNFLSLDADDLRQSLLSMKGIGRETADSIILYASGQPIFVIDAYTRRILGRVYGLEEDYKSMSYDELQRHIESKIKRDLELYQDFHAQIVQLGKDYCLNKPICKECPLNEICSYNMHSKQIDSSKQ